MSVNKAIIVGNLGADPEVRYLTNGDAVANISIATSESWKDKQTGEKVEKTEWHRVVMFRRLGEIAGQYLKKGSKVYIEGKLQTRKYDKQGIDTYSTEIVANQMQMLDSKSDATTTPVSTQPIQSPVKPPGPQPAAAETPFDDDIPF